MLQSARKFLTKPWVCMREFFTLMHAENKISHLTLIDRIEIRTEAQKAVQMMREAERTKSAAPREQLARMALERLIVATAAFSLKARSSSPVDWPDLTQAIRVTAELPALSKREYTLSCVFESEHSAILADRQYALIAKLFACLRGKSTRAHLEIFSWYVACE